MPSNSKLSVLFTSPVNSFAASFQHIVNEIDFEAIYKHDPVYSEIPLDPVTEKIREFIIELDERNLTQFDSDVIGQIYEGVIPPERRKEMGEYYTPPAICDLITRLTVTDASDYVLDPACGSGGFLISAYHRLQELLPESTGGHNRILTQLSGVEINQFPAHLTTINLAIQDLSSYTNDVDVETKDFFNVTPNQRLRREQASAQGGETTDEVTEQMRDYDAVVANPPYIRQENIDDKKHVREHLGNQEIDSEGISSRSDIYTYFITHATEFLADDGQLGFITSDRWLDTEYGEDIQEFILDNYNIRAIITFDRQVFDDALVDSSVFILQRETDDDVRDDNVAKFIRIQKEMSIEEITDLVEDDYDTNQMILSEDNTYRIVTRKQVALYHENKWNVFFFAPPVYFDIDANPKVVQLSDIATVTYGVKTGANPFFMGKTEDMDDLGLEPYTTPLLKASGQVDTIKVTEDVTDEWRILDLDSLVNQILDNNDKEFGKNEEEIVKEWLEDNGHDALLEYIQSGEDEGYHERSSISSRDVWFDLGNLPRPHILSTMFTWRVHRVYWNEPKAATSDQFYYINPAGDREEKTLAGILNSRIVWLANELKGRRAGGEGMTRLQTKVYETETWPVPDPATLTEEQQDSIKEAFDNLMDRESEVDEATHDSIEAARDALDKTVLDVLGFEDTESVLDELKQAVNAMVDMRDEGAGSQTTVLVERDNRVDETGAIELPGVEYSRETTKISDFNN